MLPDAIRCSCLRRRESVQRTPIDSQQLEEQLKQLMGDRMNDPNVRQMVERVAEVVRKRET